MTGTTAWSDAVVSGKWGRILTLDALVESPRLDAARAKRGDRRRCSPTCPLDDRCQSDNNAGAWKSVRQS